MEGVLPCQGKRKEILVFLPENPRNHSPPKNIDFMKKKPLAVRQTGDEIHQKVFGKK